MKAAVILKRPSGPSAALEIVIIISVVYTFCTSGDLRCTKKALVVDAKRLRERERGFVRRKSTNKSHPPHSAVVEEVELIVLDVFCESSIQYIDRKEIAKHDSSNEICAKLYQYRYINIKCANCTILLKTQNETLFSRFAFTKRKAFTGKERLTAFD